MQTKETKIIKIFNIKISISKKNYLSKFLAFILKSLNVLYLNKKRYEYIIPIGENCHFSIRFNKFYKFVDSTLLNWAAVRNIEKLPEILNNPNLIYSEGFSYIQERNMYLCNKYHLSFHARSCPSELLTDDGTIDEKKKEEEFTELKSRIKYLAEKTQKYIKSEEKKLYVFTSENIKTKSDFVKLLKILDSLKSLSENFDMLLILISEKENKLIDEIKNTDKNLFIRKINQENEDLDWAKLFLEFAPKTKLKQKRIRKYEYID